MVVALWQQCRPAPRVTVPPLHPPRPARVQAPADGGAQAALKPEDEPIVDETPSLLRPPSEVPEEPTRRDLENGMARVKSHVARCQSLENVTGVVTVRI